MNFYITFNSNININLINNKIKGIIANNDNSLIDKYIKKLINLEYLEFIKNTKITNDGIKNLINLKFIELINSSHNFTNFGFKKLYNLKAIGIDINNKITDNRLINLII